jgi:TatD DNase family protein
MIDSHCHLAGDAFEVDLEQVIARAKSAGLERALVVLAGGDARESGQAQRVLDLWPEVRVAVGVHPHSALEFGDDPGRAARVVRVQVEATPSCRAIGEIGLDYHYDFSPRDVQREVFRSQIGLARALGLPVVVHTREADADTVDILRDACAGGLRGVLHCFTGPAELARAGLDLGLHVSLAGIITFPRAGELREVVRQVPLERLLAETDSPFLAPVPHRGKRNEPAHVARVVGTLAEIYGIEAAEVARRTTANFHSLFRP